MGIFYSLLSLEHFVTKDTQLHCLACWLGHELDNLIDLSLHRAHLDVSRVTSEAMGKGVL